LSIREAQSAKWRGNGGGVGQPVSMSLSHRTIVTAALVGMGLVGIVISSGLVLSRGAHPRLHAINAAEFTIQFWNWSAGRVLDREEEADLAALPTQAICSWCGVVTDADGHLAYHRRAGRITGCPQYQEWEVVRIEPSCKGLLTGNDAALLSILQTEWLARQASQPAATGLQIDWDVPTRLLSHYAGFLRRLRLRLPAHTGLSCTGLVTWLDSPDLQIVVRAVDWWVPQCYSSDLPTDPMHMHDDRLLSRESVQRVCERSAALERPFRIGLPTYEQASWWDASAHLLAASTPMRLEKVLVAGLIIDSCTGGAEADAAERLIRFHAPHAMVVAGRDIPSGATLLIGQATVASLHAQIADTRRYGGRWCRGISLFRLSAPGDLPSLSTSQIRAAWAVTLPPSPTLVSHGHLSRSWCRQPDGWRLEIANRSLADEVHILQPMQLSIDCLPDLGMVAPPMRMVPAAFGVPSGPAHATETLLFIPFLRAGATWNCVFQTNDDAPPDCHDVPVTDTP
jgi:hypothetical protein